jgi:replicative DNA helicase
MSAEHQAPVALKAINPGGALEQLRYCLTNPGVPIGTPTGYEELDYLTGGLPKDELIVLAAQPGLGKTAFGLSVALNAAEAGYDVAIFSQEMSETQIVRRLASMISGIPWAALRTGYYVKGSHVYHAEPSLYKSYEAAIEKAATLPILIVASGVTTLEMKNALEEALGAGLNIDLIINDYIQLHHDSLNSNPVENLTKITRNLKQMTLDYHIPILALSQLSREIDKRGGEYEPQLSDLRGSGSVGQDANQVWFLKRDDYYERVGERPGGVVGAELLVSKNRDGETGRVGLNFDKQSTRFLGKPSKRTRGAA